MIKVTAVLVAAKLAGRVSRLLRRGDGQALPGVIADALMPELAGILASQFRRGVVIVTGTNGKTTTTKLLTEMLTVGGLRVISNSSGSNMKQGILSSLVAASGVSGVLRGAPTVGVFEVDEGTVPQIMRAIDVTDVLVTNLFRDQLDRYGDLDTVAAAVGVAVRGASARVHLNADDPMVASLCQYVEASRITYFGVQFSTGAVPTLQTAGDSVHCPQCGTRLEFGQVFYSHLGHYHCSGCDFSRPHPAVQVLDVVRTDAAGSVFKLQINGQDFPGELKLGGLYNLYNALAALAVAQGLGVSPDVAVRSMATAAPAFGRAEEIDWGGRILKLILVKNPAGCTQVLESFLRDLSAATIVIGINDLEADGRDVSWLWDVPFECLAGRGHYIIAAGSRAHDIKLRLYYGGVESTIAQSIPDAVDAMGQLIRAGETGYLLTTYTAMYAVRKHVRRSLAKMVRA